VNYSRVDARKHFFCNRIVKTWNSLGAQPDDFASFSSFNRFINAMVIAQDCLLLTIDAFLLKHLIVCYEMFIH